MTLKKNVESTNEWSGETTETAAEMPLFLRAYRIKLFDSGELTANMEIDDESGTELTKCSLSKIIYTSDATPGTCVFTMPTKDATDDGVDIEEVLIDQEVAIQVAVEADGAVEWRTVFKGTVVDKSHTIGSDGAHVSVQCDDMKARMASQVINKEYNQIYDIASMPNFSEKNRHEKPLETQAWSVKEIIEDIFATSEKTAKVIPDKYRPLVWFSFDDVNFDNVDELDEFIPQPLKFSGETIIEAIYKTLMSAGQYRIVYDQEDDKLVIVRISRKADGCGDKLELNYATIDADDPNSMYWNHSADYTVNVISDSSYWKTSDAISILKMYGEKIEWYTGHYIIKSEVYTMDDLSDENREALANENAQYNIPARNWDGYEYVAQSHTITKYLTDDDSENEGVLAIVGAPLYPQWITSSGYDAYEVPMDEDTTRSLPLGENGFEPEASHPSWTDDYYERDPQHSDTEYEGFTNMDRAFVGEPEFKSVVGDSDILVATGYTYEAWMPWPGACLYCNGSGAVDDITPWAGKEEEWFGISRNADGTRNTEVASLTPFDYGFSEYTGMPSHHPVPWENMCPACRGTGQEPMFKITNIMNNLMDVTPDKVKIEGQALSENESMSWDEMVKDLSYSYGPQIYTETQTHEVAFDESAFVQHSLANLRSKTDRFIDVFDDDEKYLAYVYKTGIGQRSGATIDHKRGNVILKSKAGILCRKPVKPIKRKYDKASGVTYALKNKSDGHATVYCAHDEYGFSPKTETYWRPPRAWITCFFTRERLYDDLGDVEYDNRFEVSVGDIDGTYDTSPAIENGALTFDVSEYAEEDDDGQIEFNIRPVYRSESGRFRIQICPYDIYNGIVPSLKELESGDFSFMTEDGWTPESVFQNRVDDKYYFPCASIGVAEPLRQNEAEALSGKISLAGIGRGDTFLKPLKWVLRDDRMKMLVAAIRSLERRNDIKIGGNITLSGFLPDMSSGMGYVTKDYNGTDVKSCVVKIEHSFIPAHTTNIEVSTEEMRIGEEREDELDYKRRMENKIADLYLDSNRAGSVVYATDESSVPRLRLNDPTNC